MPKAKKETRIEKEETKLKTIFANIETKRKDTISGLIRRAAFMKILLEDLEADINENGYTEDFSQGNQEPYKRKRPETDLYSTTNSNYQKIIKQLTDLLPKEGGKPSEGGDEDEFVSF